MFRLCGQLSKCSGISFSGERASCSEFLAPSARLALRSAEDYNMIFVL